MKNTDDTTSERSHRVSRSRVALCVYGNPLAARVTWQIVAVLMLVLSYGSHAMAQTPADPDETLKDQIVTAYSILFNEGVLDSFGHISARSVDDPTTFLMPRAMPPSLVTRADILRFRIADSQPIDPHGARVNGERYIHGEIYKARADVKSVIHAHSQAVIPLTVSGITLKPVVAQAGFLPLETPTFESRDSMEPGSRGMQITTSFRGAALARKLGANPVVLLRGHGEAVAAHSVEQAVVYAVYIDIDARMQQQALVLSPKIIALSPPELFTEQEFDINRVWESLRAKLLDPAQRATIDRSQFGLSQTQSKQ